MDITDFNTFNEELLNMLCSEQTNKSDDICLISNEILEENHIKLSCNHKFNYNCIFHEIKNQKRYSNLEVQKIRRHQIKCPYCRSVQNGLLPSREGYDNIVGVNWPKKDQFLPHSCVYEFKSGKRKGEFCGNKCSEKYCTNHLRIINNRIKKENEKLKKKNEKLQKKKEKLQEKCQNIEAIQKNMKTGVFPCSYIFKRGKNKGSRCSCQKIYKENLCKTHYNLCLKRLTKLKHKLEKENPNLKIENITINDNKTNIKFTKKNQVISI